MYELHNQVWGYNPAHLWTQFWKKRQMLRFHATFLHHNRRRDNIACCVDLNLGQFLYQKEQWLDHIFIEHHGRSSSLTTEVPQVRIKSLLWWTFSFFIFSRFLFLSFAATMHRTQLSGKGHGSMLKSSWPLSSSYHHNSCRENEHRSWRQYRVTTYSASQKNLIGALIWISRLF